MTETTATTINIGSRVFKTRKGAVSEMERSLDYAANGGCSLDVIEHDGGWVVVYISEHPAETARRWLTSGQILDAMFA